MKEIGFTWTRYANSGISGVWGLFRLQLSVRTQPTLLVSSSITATMDTLRQDKNKASKEGRSEA